MKANNERRLVLIDTQMQLTEKLEKAILIKRYKRFLADVKLPGGEIIVAHCPNPGSMIGCAEPGAEVWLRHSNDAKRKLPYTWVVTRGEKALISVDTLMANKLVKQSLTAGAIPQLSGYKRVVPEFKLKDSRYDFYLSDGLSDQPSQCLVEVKSTTLAYGDVAMFPDAKTDRGRKHLLGLMEARAEGYRAVQFYCISRNDTTVFKPAEHIDPAYTATLKQAVASGVEVMAWVANIVEKDGQFQAMLSHEIPIVI